jgi:hypothetical protein
MNRRFAFVTWLLLAASASAQPAVTPPQRIRNHFDSDAFSGPRPSSSISWCSEGRCRGMRSSPDATRSLRPIRRCRSSRSALPIDRGGRSPQRGVSGRNLVRRDPNAGTAASSFEHGRKELLRSLVNLVTGMPGSSSTKRGNQ